MSEHAPSSLEGVCPSLQAWVGPLVAFQEGRALCIPGEDVLPKFIAELVRLAIRAEGSLRLWLQQADVFGQFLARQL